MPMYNSGMEEEPTQKSRIEQFVQVGVVVFLLVTTAIFFTHGINVSGTSKQFAATTASVPPPPVQNPSAPAPAVPPPPVSREEATGCPKGASCQTSQPKEIKPVGDCADPKASPQIQAECKQQEAIAKSQIARCTQGEKKKEICKPYEISKVVYTSKSCFLKSGETIVKCKPKPTPECPTVSSTTGALCTWESKDPNCQCKKGGEENNKKPGDAPVAKSTDDIAKQVSGTEDGQGGGSGSGGSPGGGGQSPQDEAIAQAFEDPNTPPLPEQRSEALKQHDQELAQQIEQAEQALDNYYDSDVQNLEEERRLNENYERLVQERAELAPYVRQALLDDKQEIDANPSSSNWPSERQNIDGRISELDRLMQEYGVQGAGAQNSQGTQIPYNTGVNESPLPQYTTASCYGTSACGDSSAWADSQWDAYGRRINPETDRVIAAAAGRFPRDALLRVERLDAQNRVVAAAFGRVADVCGYCTRSEPSRLDFTTALARDLGFSAQQGVVRIRVYQVGR